MLTLTHGRVIVDFHLREEGHNHDSTNRSGQVQRSQSLVGNKVKVRALRPYTTN